MAKERILKNAKVFGRITDIVISGGKIASVGKADGEGLDLGGMKVYPGLIDVHCHGLCGMDTMDEEDNLEKMSLYQLESGTTTWYPTTMTAKLSDIVRATSKNINVNGANIPGFHLEGPFINPIYRGAQSALHILEPSAALIDECASVRRMTLAPELPGSPALIESRKDVQFSLGHSDADHATASEAFRVGVSSLTHTFNAMKGIHHREPGPISAALDNEGVYFELIADGKHVHPSAVRMLVKAAGKERIVLISDSMRARGLGDGESELGGQKITVNDGIALTPDGKLAGSVSSLFECVKSIIGMGIPEEDAFRMASENPARLMKLNKGKIEAGYDADFVIVDDKCNLVKAIVRGEF